MDSPAAGSLLLEGNQGGTTHTEHREFDSWAGRCRPWSSGQAPAWVGGVRDAKGCGRDIKQEGTCLVLEWGPAGCLAGGLPTSTPTCSSRRDKYRRGQGHLGSSHTHSPQSVRAVAFFS